MAETSRTKAAARCTACGTALAAWKTPDGAVYPIGNRRGCPCGGDEFELLS